MEPILLEVPNTVEKARGANLIRKQIASKKRELKELTKSHQQATQDFNARLIATQKRALHLEGAIAALQELLPKPSAPAAAKS